MTIGQAQRIEGITASSVVLLHQICRGTISYPTQQQEKEQ